jgi:MFS family permease
MPGVAGWGAVPVAPKPGVIPLRPLGVGEILDGAISYMRRDPKTVLGISALVAAASALLQFATYASLGRWFDTVLSNPSFNDGSTPSDSDVRGLFSGLAAVGGLFLLFIAITFLLSVLATGMLTTALGRAVLGQHVSPGEVWQRARERFWPLLGLTLLVGLVLGGVAVGGILLAVALGALLEQAASGLGVFVGVIAGIAAVLVTIWLGIKLLLAPAALILEGVGPVQAIRRSYRLTSGAWWRTFGIYVLATIIGGVVSQVITIPFALIGGLGAATTASADNPFTLTQAFVTAISTLVSQTIVVPFGAGIVALLYIDRRIRREALDIELARAAGVPAAPRP